MDRNTFLEHIADLTLEDIVIGIRAGEVTFEELRETGDFSAHKQKLVKNMLAKYEEEDNAFRTATTLDQLRGFLLKYPESEHSEEVNEKINQIEKDENEEKKKKLDKIKESINEYTPDEIHKQFDQNILSNLCKDLGIDFNIVSGYVEPKLTYNEIPQNGNDIPPGYTDVFFWGMPSSGKTCALSAIFSTIKAYYTMDEPNIAKKFGATYRHNLGNIFKTNIGYLPDSTAIDRTQYMPFLLKSRNEKKYRQISFFELSGEVFKSFYEIVNGSEIFEGTDKKNMESSFSTLSLLLNSKNQKIHFFFIDYHQERKGAKDIHGLTQSDYLESAATYFRDNNYIFKEKTDAVYVVVSKADEIPGNNVVNSAGKFLNDNFGNFMDVLKNRCKKDSVKFDVRIFSIGDVFFKRICKINRDYSKDIIDEILNFVKPVSENKFINHLNN